MNLDDALRELSPRLGEGVALRTFSGAEFSGELIAVVNKPCVIIQPSDAPTMAVVIDHVEVIR